MSVSRRALLALPPTVLLTGAWMPREESTWFVQSLYEKEGAEWPDLGPKLRRLFEADSKRPASRIDFNWLQGGPLRQSQVDALRVTTTNRSGRGRAVVEATFTNHGQAYARRFLLVRGRNRWLVDDVRLTPEDLDLSAVLASEDH